MEKYELENLIVDTLDHNLVDEAFEHLETYENTYGPDYFFYMALSDALMQSGLYEDVLDVMDDAIESGFQDTFVTERKADAYFALEDFKAALNYYNQCDIQSDNDDMLHVRMMIGLCYKNLMEYSEAVNYFEDVLLEVQEDTSSLYQAGVCYFYLGQTERGYEYLDKYCMYEPAGPQALCELLMDEDLEPVLLHYASQIDLPLLQNEILFSYYQLREDYEHALPYIFTLAQLDPDIENKLDLALTYEELDQHDQAIPIFKEIAAMPDDPEDIFASTMNHLLAFKALGVDADQYNTYISEHMDVIRENIFLYVTVLRFLLEIDNFQMAAKLHELELDPSVIEEDDALYQYYQILYYLKARKFEEGIAYIQSLDYRDYDFLDQLLVTLYFYAENYEKVLEIYPDAMPDGIIAHMAFASYISVGKEKEAFDFMVEFAEYLKEYPDIPNAELFIHIMEDYISKIDIHEK